VSLFNEQLEQFVASLVETPGLWRHLVRHDSERRVYDTTTSPPSSALESTASGRRNFPRR
jgi:hypothetical protein